MTTGKKVLCEILGLALSAAMLTGCEGQAESGSEPSHTNVTESEVQPSDEASGPESTEYGSVTDAAEENSEALAADSGESLMMAGKALRFRHWSIGITARRRLFIIFPISARKPWWKSMRHWGWN